MSSTIHPNNNKKARWGWAMFDWANSVYSLVITTAIFPIYFHALAKTNAVRIDTDVSGVENAYVNFMGMEIKSISLLSLGVAIAYVIIAILSPILGSIADYSGNKKKYMMAFTGLGSLSCGLMYFFEPSTFFLGFWLFILAAIGYAGGAIFNDAFLPEITTPDKYDRMSARGYALGYIGSVVLLIFNLIMIMMPQFFFDVAGKQAELLAASPGLDPELALTQAAESFTGIASRISFLTVGIWWFGFSMITFYTLKDVKPAHKPKNPVREGIKELRQVLGRLSGLRLMKRYLLAFFFFDMGLQTVMYMASSFGAVELQMSSAELIISVLVIQVVAIAGAYLFAALSKKLGNFKALMYGVGVWIGVCIAAYFVTDAYGFYALGFAVGMIMGGMQALSRATYSKLIPTDSKDTASFFSFFSIVDKIAIVLGTTTFGILSNFIGTKNTIMSLIIFFLIGAYLIWDLSRSKDLNPELLGE